jgi:hypothetical protein
MVYYFLRVVSWQSVLWSRSHIILVEPEPSHHTAPVPDSTALAIIQVIFMTGFRKMTQTEIFHTVFYQTVKIFLKFSFTT